MKKTEPQKDYAISQNTKNKTKQKRHTNIVKPLLCIRYYMLTTILKSRMELSYRFNKPGQTFLCIILMYQLKNLKYIEIVIHFVLIF